MKKKHMGWVHQGKYAQHQHRVIDMAKLHALVERITAEELAKLDTEEKPRPVPQWFTKSNEEREEPMHKVTCPNCGSDFDADDVQKREAFNTTIKKGFDAIMAQHSGERGRFDHFERDRKLSALHRAEQMAKAKGLL